MQNLTTFENRQILVLAPHPDDGELGAGGTISKFIRLGATVHYVAFSPCHKSLPSDLPPDTLEIEMRQATETLGIPPGNVQLYDFSVREFPDARQEILERLIKLRQDFQPDIVLLPCATDIHQDHGVIHAEGRRAFKHCTLLGYELPWNTFSFQNGGYVSLDEQDVQRKVDALSKYASQAHRPYTNGETLRSLAKLRGMQAGAVFAEAFEVIRWILR